MTDTTHKKTPPCDSSARILEKAMELFARHGFHGVTTRRIAAAVKLNIATIHHHMGSKSDLYLRVFEQLHEEEKNLVGQFIREVDRVLAEDSASLRQVLMGTVDALVDLFERNPCRAHLYMRRWLEADDGLAAVEAEHSLRLHASLNTTLENARKAGRIRSDADIQLIMRSLDWLIYGYFVTGPVEKDTWHGDPHSPENLTRFRSWLHDYIDSMLGLNEAR